MPPIKFHGTVPEQELHMLSGNDAAVALAVHVGGTVENFVRIMNDRAAKLGPKAISERTSYIRVRLEFLRYPHLIPGHFNDRGFGPPSSFTLTSSWTWIGHPVSGRIQLTKTPYSDLLSLRLRSLRT